MELNRIAMPNPNPENRYVTYKNQLQPRFESAEAAALFQSRQAEILEIVESEIRDYITNDDLCNDDERMFPRRCVLTGEWYVRSVTLEENDLFVETALLGTDLGYPDDYLGLDVILYYDAEGDAFTPDGVNSAAL